MTTSNRLQRAALEGDVIAIRQSIDDARRRADPHRLSPALQAMATHQSDQLHAVLTTLDPALIEQVLATHTITSATLALDMAATLGWCPRFVPIEPGTYRRGGRLGTMWDDADEHPAHQVEISTGFWMASTPVTQAQWQAVMGDLVPAPSVYKHPERPVERITWDNAQHYCTILATRTSLSVASPGISGLRLPTEGEWEYACRAGTQTDTYAGDLERPVGTDPVLEPLAWYWDNSDGRTHPVGQRAPNAWGLYDMLGNVQEWCLDWYGPYDEEPQRDPTGPPSGIRRVFRGGSWDVQPMYCRAARRSDFRASAGFSGVQGMRPVWGSGVGLKKGAAPVDDRL